jgi:hypothetical protein
MGMSRYHYRHDRDTGFFFTPASSTAPNLGMFNERLYSLDKAYCYCSKTDGGECAKKQRLPVPACNCKCHTKVFQSKGGKTKRKKK